MKKYLLLFACIFSIAKVIAQDKPDITFNHVLLEDFNMAKLKVDTSFGAVIIADIGSSSFEGNNNGWFTLIYKHLRRIKVIDKKGYDLAIVQIPLYQSVKAADKEELVNLKASAYNIVNGVVVETRLDKAAVYEEQLDKKHLVKKFTLPAVKEGTIIEYSYTILSDFLFNLQPWRFQGAYPRVWSEYSTDIPAFFEYVFIAQGYNPFDIKSKKTKFNSYTVRNREENAGARAETFKITSNNTISRWVIKNVPALKEEKFTSSLDNHISAIEFQLSGEQFPNQPYKKIMGSWTDLSTELIQEEEFGKGLDKYNAWLNEDMKGIKTGTHDKLAQAKNIFDFVKLNIKCKGIHNISLSAPLKEIFKSRTGYAEDINLLLIAMLRHLDIEANPVILSTRANGFTNEFYPLVQKFNYVICQARIDSVQYFLDASNPLLGFNKLPEYCYNGVGRVIGISPVAVYLYADSIKENKLTAVTLFNNDTIPGKWSGSVNARLGYYESNSRRQQIATDGKAAFEQKIKEVYTGKLSVEDIKYTDESDADLPMTLAYTINLNSIAGSSIIYFNPMLKEGYTENIFTATERKYPVEMPFQQEKTYLLHMDIPEGYIVDELPKSAKVTLNKEEGYFEYLIEKTEKGINLRTQIKLNKANFLPQDYETLRNFFDFIVKKHAEQIVFKKK